LVMTRSPVQSRTTAHNKIAVEPIQSIQSTSPSLPRASIFLDRTIVLFHRSFWNIAPVCLVLFFLGMFKIYVQDLGPLFEVLGNVLEIGAICLSFPILILIIAQPSETTPLFDEIYKRTFKSVVSYISVLLLAIVVIVGGLSLFVIPGIIVVVLISLSLFVFVLERKTGINALIQSWKYVRAYWWQIAWRIVYLVLILITISFILGLVFLVLKALISGGVASALSTARVISHGQSMGATILDQVLNSFFAIPFSIIYLYGVYDVLRSFKPVAISVEKEKQIRNTIVSLAIVGIIALVYIFMFRVSLMERYGEYFAQHNPASVIMQQ
jgi:hypothetical protein